MKRALFCISALFTCIGIFAQQQPVVAVAPFDAISGINATEANMISRAFNIRLGNTHSVILVDRDIVERIIQEHSFQAGDWSDQQKTAELGRALNANWIVRGNFERFGNNVLFTISFYDIATFQFRGGDEVRVANADAAYDHIPNMVNNLITVIERAGSAPPVTRSTRPVQGGNTGASAYYGTWLWRDGSTTATLIIDENRVTLRHSGGGFLIISNPTWTVANNNDINRLVDFPIGFQVFGTITDIGGGWSQGSAWRPIFLFIHRSDSNRMHLYRSLNDSSEIQNTTAWQTNGFGRVQ